MSHFTAARILSTLLCALALASGCSDGDREVASPAVVWPARDLVAVDVVDGQSALVVAATGEIHRTLDAGRTWQRSQSPPATALRRIAMADVQHGWVTGDGLILHTDDGGASWRPQRIPGRATQTRFAGLAAIDSMRAIALGDDGLRLRTLDGGEVWREVVRSGEPDFGPRFADVDCLPDGSGRCWSIGGAIRFTRDAGETWHRGVIESPYDFAPLEFGSGRVELTEGERDRLLRFVESLRAHRDLQWRIEAGASAREIQRILRQRDPMAALELIETRAQEVLSQIEEAGIAPERITLVGAPPWDYEDYLDDDPEFLERYWIAHTFARPGVRVRVTQAPVLAAIRVRDEATGLAVGRDGVVLRSEEQGQRWRQTERFTVQDLFGLAFGHRRRVAVGAQGGVWLAGDDAWSWSRPDPERLPPFFETLRSVDFSPSGDFGLIVGSRGRILRSLDGGEDWTLLEPDRSP